MSTQNGNLDISQVGTEDLEQLAKKIEDFYKSDAAVKNQLAWNWERAHLMVDGKQWLSYDGNRDSGGQWKPLKISKANEYIPRPTTNYMFDIYQTLKSYLIKNKPRSSVTANTPTSRDKMAAKIANLVVEANYERLKEQANYEYAAACVVMYGTVIKKDYWDTSALSMAKVPRMSQEPVIDPMSGQPTGQMREVPVTDPQSGEQIFDEIPLGDVNTCIVEPQRFTLDPLATTLTNPKWVMETTILPLALVKELYDKDPEQHPGYTGLAKELDSENNLNNSMQRFVQLKNSSGVKTGVNAAADGVQGNAEMPENSVVLKEYYERPCLQYPKGRLIVVGNGKTLYAGESSCEGPDQGDWHPYSECRWEILPGRFWGKGPIDDGVEVQKNINAIDSVIVLVRKTMAIPQKLIPLSSGVSPGQWTGRPGQELFYRADPSGAAPATIPPTGVDQQVFAERSQRLEDLKQITGAIDILKGDRPPGVTAASALNLLYEVGTGKLFPILDRWKTFVESSQKKQLRLVAKYYKEPRADFIKMLKSKNRELSPEAIDKFIGEDLYDNCNVIVEAGSNVPKLQAAKQAALMEAAQTGALNLQLPANRMEFQRQLGIQGFDNDIGPDVKRAEWENDLMDDVQLHPNKRPVLLAVDKHDIHIEVHATRMKEPSFLDLPQEAIQAYTDHMKEHQDAQAQERQAQMLEAMSMGAGGPAGAPSPQGMPSAPSPAHAGAPTSSMHQPTPIKESGTGSTKDLKNAIHQDALTPAPIGGSR